MTIEPAEIASLLSALGKLSFEERRTSDGSESLQILLEEPGPSASPRARIELVQERGQWSAALGFGGKTKLHAVGVWDAALQQSAMRRLSLADQCEFLKSKIDEARLLAIVRSNLNDELVSIGREFMARTYPGLVGEQGLESTSSKVKLLYDRED